MKSLSETLKEHNLSRISDRIESTAKRSIRLTSNNACEDATTRLGGRPNLPREFDWPTWRGEPLAFVAQLDLASLPEVPGLPLPRTGAISLFYEGGQSAWGFSPDDAGSCCVSYWPDPLSGFPLRSLPKDLEDHLRFKGVRLSPQQPAPTFPDSQDQVIGGMELTPEERESYLDFQLGLLESETDSLHRIGGFPECVQGDPKLEAHLVSHGLYCGDPGGYRTGKERGLWAGATEWELLLQVDSDDRAKMMWGDVGRIYFLIHREALARRQFDKTWLVFQCS